MTPHGGRVAVARGLWRRGHQAAATDERDSIARGEQQMDVRAWILGLPAVIPGAADGE